MLSKRKICVRKSLTPVSVQTGDLFQVLICSLACLSSALSASVSVNGPIFGSWRKYRRACETTRLSAGEARTVACFVKAAKIRRNSPGFQSSTQRKIRRQSKIFGVEVLPQTTVFLVTLNCFPSSCLIATSHRRRSTKLLGI